MFGASAQSKLAQLRVKTDQELSLILNNSLESALHLLGRGQPQRARAEKAYAEAVKLVPVVDDLHARRRLQNKLAQLRQSLERPSKAGDSRVQMACC